MAPPVCAEPRGCVNDARALELHSTGHRTPMVELGILNVSIVRLNISVVVFDLFSYADASTDRSLQALR